MWINKSVRVELRLNEQNDAEPYKRKPCLSKHGYLTSHHSNTFHIDKRKKDVQSNRTDHSMNQKEIKLLDAVNKNETTLRVVLTAGYYEI